eukprot:3777964-Pleurochrysis_carterae.AAC.1
MATSGRPITCSRSRTGGGPPSAAVSLLKKRDTEKVEHGAKRSRQRNTRRHSAGGAARTRSR